MMSWARAIGEFGATLMFAGSLPGITTTMPLAIYSLIYSTTPSQGIAICHFNRHLVYCAHSHQAV
jgi:molybdate transport system permease protein